MRVLDGDPGAWDAGGPHAVTIGVFDGVHRGHQQVIGSVRDTASRLGVQAGLITFDRHPLTVLAPASAPPLLTSLGRRLELFEELGLDTVGLLPFGDDVRMLSPEDFVTRVIVMGFAARHVAVGEDFRFGRDRAGNVQVLAMMGLEMGYEVEAVPLLNVDGPLSSSRIRGMITAGEVEAAARALGRLHELEGLAVGDTTRESRIGFPSLMLAVGHRMAVPGRGVYVASVSIESGPERPGVVYIGSRPTFGDVREEIRFHVLDDPMAFDGAPVRIRFAGRLRDERRFPDADALAVAVAEDAARARRLFGRGY